MSAMPLVLGHTLDGARWRVLHERVAIRAGPSTRSAIVGVARAGSEVESCEQQNVWIRLMPSSAPGKAKDSAWMLTDGREVGLGILLERLHTLIRPVAKQSRWDWRVTEISPGRFKLLPADREAAHAGSSPIALYRVIHERVAIRAEPSVDSRIIGVVRAGREVESCEKSRAWIRLAACAERPTPSQLYPEAWMLTDGREVGLGLLLERCVRKR
eukprot:COSAG05_NODE_478_length_9434_cov_5.178897_11_plen_214_part_00